MNFVSYEQFGVNFVSLAVTPERVAGAIVEVAGDVVEIGPIAAGPGGVAAVKAVGRIGPVDVRPVPAPELRFTATLPIDLDLEVRLAAVPNRYRGRVEVRLALGVRTAEPLSLVIDIDEVTDPDVSVELQSSGMGAGVLQRVGNIDGEVRRQVARIVNRRIGSEKARASRVIDVAALVARTWPSP